MFKLTYILTWLTIIIAVEAANQKDCHGHVCNELMEYCSAFLENCDQCEHICDMASHNYDSTLCIKECTAYHQYSPLQKEIMNIRAQQTLTIALLIVLLILAGAHFLYKAFLCLHTNKFLNVLRNKLSKRKTNISSNSKDKRLAPTNQNIITISDVERTLAPATEASMATLTTPISRRYPAENSSSPVSITDFSYENQALAVTPVFDKSNGGVL